MKIEINKNGRAIKLNGVQVMIRLEQDENTSGYVIYESDNENPLAGYDTWLETYNQVEIYLKQCYSDVTWET